jgi:hypothetical protein
MQFILDDKKPEGGLVPEAISERENLREALTKAREVVRQQATQSRDSEGREGE